MTTFTVALIVCTALCLAFKESRGLGIAGVFVLILVAPLVLGLLLVVAGLVYYFQRRRRRSEYIPKGNLLPPDEASRRRRDSWLLGLAAGVAGLLGLTYTPRDKGAPVQSVSQEATRSAPAEEIIVVRSPGGLLQTATIRADEVLDAKFTHSILGVKVGEIFPRFRVRAFYTYHVRLEPEWHVVQKDGVITALAPPLTPGLPVAIDTATIEKSVAGTWLLIPITGDTDLEALERTITTTLARKASSDEYKQRALEESRKTIGEFIRNWAVQAGQDVRSVRVLFADEPAGAIAPVAG